MEFLDKVKKVASDVASVSSKQGKKLYSIARINLEVVEKQNSVKNLYKELGYEVYKAYKEQGDFAKSALPIIKEIDELEEKIAVLRKNIDDIKNTEEVSSGDIYENSEEADFYDGQSEYVESETEPVDSE